MTSPDLVHWQSHGLALAPDTEYDSHGAYSGSARVIDDRLFLMYTGNHRDADWQRTPYQLGAWLDKQNQVTKLDQPLFVNPDHISEHFRDPQLLKYNDKYYAIIGAQEKTLKKATLIYGSAMSLRLAGKKSAMLIVWTIQWAICANVPI